MHIMINLCMYLIFFCTQIKLSFTFGTFPHESFEVGKETMFFFAVREMLQVRKRKWNELRVGGLVPNISIQTRVL